MALFKNNILLSVFVSVLAMTLWAGLLFSFSLERGLSLLSSRLGADVALIPRGSSVDAQSLLLHGDVKAGELPSSLLEFVKKIPGVKKATPQSFFSSVGASCCEKKVNIIGFEPQSDFVIEPWIREVFNDSLPPGSIIAGNEIEIGPKGFIRLFDREFPVVSQLDPIGNELDRAVFATMETVDSIRVAAEKKGYSFVSDKTNISAILLKTDEIFDVAQFSEAVHTQYDNVQIVKRKDMFSGLVRTVAVFKMATRILIIFFFAASFAAFAIAFSLSTRERKRDFAVIRLVGGTRIKLKRIVLAEALRISAWGTAAGILLGSLIFFPFRILAGDMIGVKLLLPSGFVITLIAILSILTPLLSGPLAAYRSAIKISRLDVYETLREE